MEEKGLATAAANAISPILASRSSNEAKIMALERRMAGHDSSRPGPATGVGTLSAAPNFSQMPADAGAWSNKAPTSTSYMDIRQRQPLDQLDAGLPPQGTLLAPNPGVATAHAVAVTENGVKRQRTGSSPGGHHTGITAQTLVQDRLPLSDITPDKEKDRARATSLAAEPALGHDRTATGSAGDATPVPAAGESALEGPAAGGNTAAGAVGSAGAGAQGRSRKRKQQEPKHDPRSSGSAGASAGAGTARGASASTRAVAGTSTPQRAARPPADSGGGVTPNGRTAKVRNNGTSGVITATAAGAPGALATPPALARARHLFEDPAAGGRCNSGEGSGAGGGRTAAGASHVGPLPSSAQKRSILSYYPPVLADSGRHVAAAAAAAAAVTLIPDQGSRDGLPGATTAGAQSLLQQAAAARQQQQQQQQPQHAKAVANGLLHEHVPRQLFPCQQPQHQPTGTGGLRDAAPLAVPATTPLDANDLEGTAAAAQLRQYRQQVSQLQAQVIQVQSAMAAQQAATGAEIDRLRQELEARSKEVAALQDLCRSQETTVQQAVAGEAAARASLEALQASAASESARWATEAAEAARVASEREARYRSELARVVQLSARLERDFSRNQLSTNAARLGSLTFVRSGMQIVEVWEDGTAFQQLASRRADLAAAKEEVVAAQKLLRKRLAPPPSGGRSLDAGALGSASVFGGATTTTTRSNGFFGEESTHGGGFGAAAWDQLPYMSGHEFVAADEVYKTRLALLKREEDALHKEEERLNQEKFKQIRAVKLSREEDNSPFARWQVLQDRPGPQGRPRYVLMNLLGKGGFSEVFKAYDLMEARHVCVKIHALNTSWSSAKKESYVRHAIREYDIHRSLRHPAVVGLLDVLEIDLDTFATVLELCEGGDLDTLLREHRTLPEREARCLMVQIFSGLRYLATRRIIHYDLKPANILFDSLGQAKITDFGLSKLVSEGQTQAGIELTSQGAGTYWYLPPEAFDTAGPAPPRISNKLDVWSAGVIFYGMLYGKKPYGESMSQEQMLRERIMSVQREVEFPPEPSVSAEAKDFIRRCLAWHQDRRPDVEAAATDPYLTGAAGQQQVQGGGGAAASGSGGTTSLGLGLAAVVASRR